MNPDLKSFKTNHQYVPLWDNIHYQDSVNTNLKNNSFNNPKVGHYLSLLEDNDVHRSVIEHIADFFHYLVRRNRRIKTLEQYFHGLKRFFIFAKKLDISKIESVDRNHLGAFIEYLQDENLMSSSINGYLINLYTFFGFLAEQDVVGPDILKNKYRLKMPDLLPKAIDPFDISLLLSVISTVRERALILVLLRTGMRIGELLGTKITDINFREKKIEISQAQKNYEGRIVYMSDDACLALKTWLRKRLPNKEYIFYGRGNRERLSYDRARQLFIGCLVKANLSYKGYTLHCLRHTFASELLNAGMRLECLQILLGHQNIEITRRYARLTNNTRKKEYFKAMDRIERGEVDGHYRFHN